jgi:hypothetical protein
MEPKHPPVEPRYPPMEPRHPPMEPKHPPVEPKRPPAGSRRPPAGPRQGSLRRGFRCRRPLHRTRLSRPSTPRRRRRRRPSTAVPTRMRSHRLWADQGPASSALAPLPSPRPADPASHLEWWQRPEQRTVVLCEVTPSRGAPRSRPEPECSGLAGCRRSTEPPRPPPRRPGRPPPRPPGPPARPVPWPPR